MLTLQECLDFSGLEVEEIAAIAEHEHLPDIIAAELGNYLLATSRGRKQIRGMIVDDLVCARRAGDQRHASALERVLSSYDGAHARDA